MMLDDNVAAQVREHLTKIVHPVELVASLDEQPSSTQLAELLDQLASLSDRVSVVRDAHPDGGRTPSFTIRRAGTDVAVSFAGLPLGHELSSLILGLVQVGGHPPKVDPDLLAQLAAVEGEHHFETYFSTSCQVCPEVVQALNLAAVVNPGITHVAIDGSCFPDEVEARQVLAVPSVFRNGEPFEQGAMSVEDLLAKLDHAADDRAAAALAARAPSEVRVVGGGPAGAAAAVYAARKGIRTGLVAERFGGQVLDTMSIENFLSVPHTEGPALARALENHVRDYDVDVIVRQRVTGLVPADGPTGYAEVTLANGAVLRSRTVVLATGARWRQLGVPGEDDYRNKGVTFCPHCDGPLFAGKRVAVIGGGNSGVEAAIDLAGVAGHVTVVEFDPQLRADAVLQQSMATLDNVDVIVHAASTEVLGDGARVTGLAYQDRTSGEDRVLDLDGVFVQIGLVPSTDWLDGAVERTPRGEIVIDERGATSAPGIFAAGDCTTVPYKQIVIALGAGATASLGAFDHLIRARAATSAMAPAAG
jgi:alkyl hydroperoxide reductase subunit F